MSSPFLLALVIGAGLLALWIDARFPKLAPESFSRRVLAVCGAFALLQATPLFNSSAAAVYATLFAIVLPTFVITFLTAVWLLRALRDARLSS